MWLRKLSVLSPVASTRCHRFGERYAGPDTACDQRSATRRLSRSVQHAVMDGAHRDHRRSGQHDTESAKRAVTDFPVASRLAASRKQQLPRRTSGCAAQITHRNPAYAPVTRQITLPTSSAISTEPSGPIVTPTGRPYDSFSSGARKPDRMSRGAPDGRPFTNGTKTSL